MQRREYSVFKDLDARWANLLRPRPLPPPSYPALGDAEAEQVRRLRAEDHEALAAPRQLARFLCGISSPAATRAKLRSHAMFGAFERVPFNEVLEFVGDKTP